jgi:hypothetical protein
MITKVMYGGNGAINLILPVSVIVLFVEKRSDVEVMGKNYIVIKNTTLPRTTPIYGLSVTAYNINT